MDMKWFSKWQMHIEGDIERFFLHAYKINDSSCFVESCLANAGRWSSKVWHPPKTHKYKMDVKYAFAQSGCRRWSIHNAGCGIWRRRHWAAAAAAESLVCMAGTLLPVPNYCCIKQQNFSESICKAFLFGSWPGYGRTKGPSPTPGPRATYIAFGKKGLFVHNLGHSAPRKDVANCLCILLFTHTNSTTVVFLASALNNI